MAAQQGPTERRALGMDHPLTRQRQRSRCRNEQMDGCLGIMTLQRLAKIKEGFEDISLRRPRGIERPKIEDAVRADSLGFDLRQEPPVLIRTRRIDYPCAVRRPPKRLARTNDTDDVGATRKSFLERESERGLARKDQALSFGFARCARERRETPIGDMKPVL